VLERAKSSILPNGNFREFFLWRGEFCVCKTGIPGGPDMDGPGRRHSSSSRSLKKVTVMVYLFSGIAGTSTLTFLLSSVVVFTESCVCFDF